MTYGIYDPLKSFTVFCICQIQNIFDHTKTVRLELIPGFLQETMLL